MKISAVINTYNAAEYLERVLESVKGFDEILICDMHSTDGTLGIVEKFGCRVVFHEHTGIVEPARAFAISQASHEWVLVVDADEIVPDALREYLYDHINRPDASEGLFIPRKNYLMGRFMHCAYPDHILRFMKRDKVEWPARIHATPIIDGRVDTIPGKRKELAFIHLANEPLKVTVNKMNTYTEMEMKRRKERNYGWGALLFHPAVRFFRFYIIKGGFRDGKAGFIWAKEYAYYKFMTIAKVIESKITPDQWDNDLKP